MKHSYATDEQLVKDYTNGVTAKEIAVEYGYTDVKAVMKKINKLENEGKIDRGKKYIDRGKIRALHKAGWSISKIAYEMDCSESRIENIIGE
jgi:hypothetical protein